VAKLSRRASLSEALRRYPHAAVFVAEAEDGSLVARLSLARDTHPASSHVADLGLMVAKPNRGQGIGTALLDTASRLGQEPTASASGTPTVFPWNDPAIKLYEKFGFEREGFRRGHYQRAGEDVDAILMAYPPLRLPFGSRFL